MITYKTAVQGCSVRMVFFTYFTNFLGKNICWSPAMKLSVNINFPPRMLFLENQDRSVESIAIFRRISGKIV